MAALNTGRVVLGAIAGTVVWFAWSSFVNLKVLAHRYAAAQQDGTILKQPRYSFFVPGWILTLFVLSLIIAWLYASVRTTWGAGPRSALLVGLVVGFAAGFPLSFSTATWSPISRAFPLWWMLDLWVGSVLAALIAGWLYRESRA
jgi:hypothetical protein